MGKSLQRVLPPLLPDALIVVALAFPQLCSYLRWPLLGLYAVVSRWLFKSLSEQRWVFRVVHDPAVRIAHGLEHATIAVLLENGLQVLHGFTHARGRFMVAMIAGSGHQSAAIRDAATSAIRRILEGERSLAYYPGCGTSELVSAATLWLVYASSLMCSLIARGNIALVFAIGVVLFRFWCACETPLGLLAQRLYTVSTAFSAARVVEVREAAMLAGRVRPCDETWFEVVVDVQVPASTGGIVAPGVLA